MTGWSVVFLLWEVLGWRDGGWEVGDGGAAAAFVCSGSFCFFFLADGSEAELGDCEGAEFPAETLLPFSDCFRGGFSSCPSRPEGGHPGGRVASWLMGCVSELAAALQCGRWLFNLLYVFPQNGHTSENIKNSEEQLE